MRRALQIVLLIVMAMFLVEMFTPVQLATCEATLDKKDAKVTAINTRGALGAEPQVAFQIHGGDTVFIDGLRTAFKDELAKRLPKARFIDGPPPKDAALLRMTLTAADLRWTPVYSHEGLATHTTIQLPGARAGTQITVDGNVDAVCKGLVSRSHFSSHADTIAPLATWLVDRFLEQTGESKP